MSVKAPAPVAAQVSIRLHLDDIERTWCACKPTARLVDLELHPIQYRDRCIVRKVMLQDVDDDRIDLDACYVTDAEEALRQYVPAAADADHGTSGSELPAISWSPLPPCCWCSLVRDPTTRHHNSCTQPRSILFERSSLAAEHTPEIRPATRWCGAFFHRVSCIYIYTYMLRMNAMVSRFCVRKRSAR